MTPEQLAADFIERLRLPPGVRGQFTDELTALVRAYGDERARVTMEHTDELIALLAAYGDARARAATERAATVCAAYADDPRITIDHLAAVIRNLT